MEGLPWVLPPVAAAIVYWVAVRRTAGVAAVVAVVMVAAAAGVAAALGESPRTIAGLALLCGGTAAAIWASGRSRRRGRARRSAMDAYRAGRSAVPDAAADAERLRLAAELHDTAAHRLTGIAVGAASALHVTEPALRAEALRHAAEAGRLAASELDSLVAIGAVGTDTAGAGNAELLRIDALIDSWPEPAVRYRRSAEFAAPQVAAVAYRVVREALTNAMRYAGGADVRVSVENDGDRLRVEVSDSGQMPRGGHGVGDGQGVVGLGGGHGLAGLLTAVTDCGGTFTAGPSGTGWTVVAEFPHAVEAPPVRRAVWRGRQASDGALVALALALSIGTYLLPDDTPAASEAQLALLMPLFAVHAVPLWWRRRTPGRSLAAALSIYPVMLAARAAGWSVPPAGDLFLWGCWVELALVYAAGAYGGRGRGLLAPPAVAGIGGLALALGPGITGPPAAAWAVLALGLLIPSVLVWALGRAVAAARTRRRAAEQAEHDLLSGRASAMVRAERGRVTAGVRRTALRHAEAVVAAADAGRLTQVLAEARAGLGALRDLLDELRAPMNGEDFPPTLVGLSALATRADAGVRCIGDRRPLAPAVEASVFTVARELVGAAAGSVTTVSFLPGGVAVTGRADQAGVQRLRTLADACGGSLSPVEDGTVWVWLPE